MINLRILVEF